MEERREVGREGDGEIGEEERKTFEEQLTVMWLWRVADGGEEFIRYFLCIEKGPFVPCTSQLSQEAAGGLRLFSSTFFCLAVPYEEIHPLGTPVIFGSYCSA